MSITITSYRNSVQQVITITSIDRSIDQRPFSPRVLIPLTYAPRCKTKATVKFSAGGAGRGGIVTNTGRPGSDVSVGGFARGDSFDTVDEESSVNLARDSATGEGGRSSEGGRMALRRQSSSGSDKFSVGGEDEEGYWERQCDPASGMAYYLNDKVGCSVRWSQDKVKTYTLRSRRLTPAPSASSSPPV